MSKQIERFGQSDYGMVRSEDGRWVKYDDHVAMFEAIKIENEMACGAFLTPEKLQEIFTQVITGCAEEIAKRFVKGEISSIRAGLITESNEDDGKGLLCIKSDSAFFTQGKRYDYLVRSNVISSKVLITQDEMVSDLEDEDYWHTSCQGAYLSLEVSNGKEVLFKKP